MEILPKFIKALHLQYLKMIKIHKRLTGVSHKPDEYLFKIYGLLDIIITIKLTIIPYNNKSRPYHVQIFYPECCFDCGDSQNSTASMLNNIHK